MHRPWSVVVSLALLAVMSATASAQNPFLQNRGKRTLEAIRFEGNAITREYVLRRELGFAEGDEYDPQAMTEAWERLEQLPFIAYVEIETERPGPGKAALRIRVVEEHRLRWNLGAEYERRHGKAWIGQVGLGFMNLRGRGESLHLDLEAWQRRGARLRWENPWILDTARLGVDVTAGWQRYDWEYAPLYETEFTDWSLEAGIHRAFAHGLSVHTRAIWREVGFEGNAAVSDPALVFTLEHDSRDARYYPTQGVHATAALRFAGFGDEVSDYTLIDLRNAGFVKVPRLATLAGFVGYRAASARLPLYEQTFFGGPMSIRGIDFGSVRGDEHFRASIELRRPLALLPLREGKAIGLGVHAFHDWGKAWRNGEDPSDHPVHTSYGVGAHFSFNTHNYRFEWARTEDGDNVFVFEDRFHF